MPDLIEGLRSPSFSEREEAQIQLQRMGYRARPQVEPFLQDADPEVRERVAQLLEGYALAERRDTWRDRVSPRLEKDVPGALEALASGDRERTCKLVLELRWHEDPCVCGIARKLLEDGWLDDTRAYSSQNECLLELARVHPDPGLPPLLTSLLGNLKQEALKLSVGRVLADLSTPEILPSLKVLSRDQDPSTRRAAALVMGRLGDPHGLAILRGDLNSKNYQERLRVYELLGETRRPEVLSDLFPFPEDRVLSGACLHGLGRTRLPEAARVILAGIRDKRFPENGQDPYNALGDLACPDLAAEIRALFERACRQPAFDVEPFILENTLANAGDPRDIPRLVDRLVEKSRGGEEVDPWTAQRLIRLGFSETLAELGKRKDPSASRLLSRYATEIARHQCRLLIRGYAEKDNMDPEMVQMAVMGIGHVGSSEDIPLLRGILRKRGSPFESAPAVLLELQKEIVLALGRLGDRDMIPMLRRLTDDDCAAFRRRADEVLRRLQP